MEWLINRRRMMLNKVSPPAYIEFNDSEFWRLCCINWGDYNQIVVTDNGNNTVNITTTYISKLDTTTAKSKVVSTEYNVDNSGGTYTVGTTKEALGITATQCGAVTAIGTVFRDSSILSVSDLSKLSLITSLPNTAFRNTTPIEEAIVPEGITTIGNQCFAMNGLQSAARKLTKVEYPSTITSIGSEVHFYGKISTFIIKATTPPTLSGTAMFKYGATPTYLYVPDASVDSYKAANNWSTWSSRFKPISEYTP